MNKTLDALLNKYGTETVIARLLDQLALITKCDDTDVSRVAKDFYVDFNSDTEYLYTLCEYTNLVTYSAEKAVIQDRPWLDEAVRQKILNESRNQLIEQNISNMRKILNLRLQISFSDSGKIKQTLTVRREN